MIENPDALKTELSNDEIRELDKLYGLIKGNHYDDYSMAGTLQ